MFASYEIFCICPVTKIIKIEKKRTNKTKPHSTTSNLAVNAATAVLIPASMSV